MIDKIKFIFRALFNVPYKRGYKAGMRYQFVAGKAFPDAPKEYSQKEIGEYFKGVNDGAKEGQL